MSHDIEPPVPPAEPRLDDDGLPFQRSLPAPPLDPNAQHGHIMSPGDARPRLQTLVGTTTLMPPPNPVPADIPSAPPTEVVPAPEVRKEPVVVPPARPSETIVGARSPLHTADEANTQVDVATLTPGDAERILAAADAKAKSPTKPNLIVRTPAPGGLPPPPPLRKSSFPALGHAPESTRLPSSSMPAAVPPLAPPPAVSPTPSPVSKRSYPPPPVQPNKTLLGYAGVRADGTPKPASIPPPRQAERAGPTPNRPSPSGHPPPPTQQPSRPPPPMRPRAPSAEELNSSLLMDDVSEGKVIPPQPISSSSLVEDPGSNPDWNPPEEPPPLAPPPVRPRDPLAMGGAFQAISAPAMVLAPADPAPPPVVPEPPPSPVAAAPVVVSAAPAEAVDVPVAHEEAPPSSGSWNRPTQPPAVPRPPPTIQERLARLGGPPWLLPAMAVGAAVTLAVAIGMVAFVVKWIHGAIVGDEPASVASSEPASSAPPVATTTAPEPAPITGSPCALAGAPHVIAPKALLRTGIESRASADRIALGMGLGERDGLVVEIDPSTFTAVNTVRSRAEDPLRRVIPVLNPPADVAPFFETTRRHAGIEGAHPVPADPPFLVGAAGDHLVWAPSRDVPFTRLWSVAIGAPVEAVRAVVLPKHEGYAIAFRQGASLYLGALHADKTPNGELARIGGLGPQIGAPAMAAGLDHVLVAWADRAGPSQPWAIRWVTWHPGAEPAEPTPFPLPPGGSGGQAMSPSLTSLSGGRFVMAWTEGGGSRHEVRAQALDPGEQFVGNALTVSAEGVNAGQGTPALTPDGRGAVVFLSTPSGATAQVVAVPIVCPSSG